MAMSDEPGSKFAALHLYEWKILEWDEQPPQTNKQTNKQIKQAILLWCIHAPNLVCLCQRVKTILPKHKFTIKI